MKNQLKTTLLLSLLTILLAYGLISHQPFQVGQSVCSDLLLCYGVNKMILACSLKML